MTGLDEFKARQMVQQMHRLTLQVNSFAAHAQVIRGLPNSIDARTMLQEGNSLLDKLLASHRDFQTIDSQIKPVIRGLSARPQPGGPPAAKWGNELRAGAKQFQSAVQNAEKAIVQLRGEAVTSMNQPGRTATEVDSIFDLLMLITDLVTKCTERLRRLS